MDDASIQAILEQYNLLHDQVKEYNEETKEMKKVHSAAIRTRKDKVAPILSEITKLENQIKEYLRDRNETSIVYDNHEYHITEVSKHRKLKSDELLESLQKEMNLPEDQINDILGLVNRKITSTAPSLNVTRKYT